MQKILLHVDDELGWQNQFAEIVHDFIDPDIIIKTAEDVASGIDQFRKLYIQSSTGKILFVSTILDLYLDKEGTTTSAPIYATILETNTQFANRAAVWSGNDADNVTGAFSQEKVTCPLNIFKKSEMRPLIAFVRQQMALSNP